MEPRTEKIDVRLSPTEKEALRQAAAKAGRELSDFVRRKVLRGLKMENEPPQAGEGRAR